MSCAFGMKEENCPTDLESASEILEQVESSLDDVNETASGSCDFNCPDEDKKMLENEKYQTQFTNLVKKLNDSISADTLTVLRHYLDTHPESSIIFPLW